MLRIGDGDTVEGVDGFVERCRRAGDVGNIGAEGVQGAECVHCLVVTHADFVGVVEYVVKQTVEVCAVELVSSAGVLECLDCFYSVGGEVNIIFHIGNFCCDCWFTIASGRGGLDGGRGLSVATPTG